MLVGIDEERNVLFRRFKTEIPWRQCVLIIIWKDLNNEDMEGLETYKTLLEENIQIWQLKQLVVNEV